MTQLKNILDFVAVAPSGTTIIPHGLNYNGIGERPDVVGFDTALISVLAVDTVNITLMNDDTVPLTGRCYVERFHSFNRAVGVPDVFAGSPFIFGGGGGGIPPLIGTLNAVLRENPIGVASWGQLTSDDLAAPFAVTLNTSPTVREVGDALVNPAFTVGYTGGTPVAATLSEGSGDSTSVGYGGPVALISPYTAGSLVGTWNARAGATGNNDNRVFQVSADASGGPTGKIDTVNVIWQPRVYWGDTVPATYDQAFILALANNQLAANRNRTITNFSAGVGEFLYYAIPTSYGTPTFTVNGFAGGFSKRVESPISVINGNGHTQDYDLWISDNAALGSPTVVVT